MKYWLQTQAPAGNWVDSIGSDDQEVCQRHGAYLAKHGETVRVVERQDIVLTVLAPR